MIIQLFPSINVCFTNCKNQQFPRGEYRNNTIILNPNANSRINEFGGWNFSHKIIVEGYNSSYIDDLYQVLKQLGITNSSVTIEINNKTYVPIANINKLVQVFSQDFNKVYIQLSSVKHMLDWSILAQLGNVEISVIETNTTTKRKARQSNSPDDMINDMIQQMVMGLGGGVSTMQMNRDNNQSNQTQASTSKPLFQLSDINAIKAKIKQLQHIYPETFDKISMSLSSQDGGGAQSQLSESNNAIDKKILSVAQTMPIYKFTTQDSNLSQLLTHDIKNSDMYTLKSVNKIIDSFLKILQSNLNYCVGENIINTVRPQLYNFLRRQISGKNMILLHGDPGNGKTQLAKNFGYFFLICDLVKHHYTDMFNECKSIGDRKIIEYGIKDINNSIKKLEDQKDPNLALDIKILKQKLQQINSGSINKNLRRMYVLDKLLVKVQRSVEKFILDSMVKYGSANVNLGYSVIVPFNNMRDPNSDFSGMDRGYQNSGPGTFVHNVYNPARWVNMYDFVTRNGHTMIEKMMSNTNFIPCNVVICCDEVEKQQDRRGAEKPGDALLNIMDHKTEPENKYLKFAVGFSKSVTFCTANSLDALSRPFLDRNIVVKILNYADKARENIFKQKMQTWGKAYDWKDGFVEISPKVIKQLSSVSNEQSPTSVRNLHSIATELKNGINGYISKMSSLKSEIKNIQITNENLSVFLPKIWIQGIADHRECMEKAGSMECALYVGDGQIVVGECNVIPKYQRDQSSRNATFITNYTIKENHDQHVHDRQTSIMNSAINTLTEMVANNDNEITDHGLYFTKIKELSGTNVCNTIKAAIQESNVTLRSRGVTFECMPLIDAHEPILNSMSRNVLLQLITLFITMSVGSDDKMVVPNNIVLLGNLNARAEVKYNGQYSDIITNYVTLLRKNTNGDKPMYIILPKTLKEKHKNYTEQTSGFNIKLLYVDHVVEILHIICIMNMARTNKSYTKKLETILLNYSCL